MTIVFRKHTDDREVKHKKAERADIANVATDEKRTALSLSLNDKQQEAT